VKILALMDADWFFKGPHQYHHLLELLSLKGHEIIVVDYENYWHLNKGPLFSPVTTFQNVGRFYENARINVIRPSFIRIPFLDYLSFLFSSKKQIKNLVNDFKPDIIIGFTGVISVYWGMKQGINNDIPVIYYWLDVIHELIPLKIARPLAKILEKKIIKNSASNIAINELLKDYMISMGADPVNTHVVRGGVDFKHFDPKKIDGTVIREKYGISEDDRLLFFMGWIYEFSGLEEVIQDMLLHKDQNPGLKLMIVGHGDYYSTLKEIVKNNKMEDRVIFTGKRPYNEIPQLISAADICLLPAHNNEVMKDIVPIKMYEYLAMHKPVICTALPGVMREFKKDNGVIYVNKSEDVIKMVFNLTDSDINLYKAKAKDFIKDYDWDKIITLLQEILGDLKQV